jgi:hypothetical protein
MKQFWPGAILIFMGLAGCQAPEDLMQQKPTLVLDLMAKPEEVRDCITSPHPGTFLVTPHGDGWIVMWQIMGLVGGPEDTGFVVQIDRTATGSHVTTFRKSFYGAGYDQSVIPCVKTLH